MSVSKSELIKQLKIIYPNLLKKDLLKIFDIFLNEIKIALKNEERVELRGWGIFYQKTQRGRNSRNPKTGETIYTLEKKKWTSYNSARISKIRFPFLGDLFFNCFNFFWGGTCSLLSPLGGSMYG